MSYYITKYTDIFVNIDKYLQVAEICAPENIIISWKVKQIPRIQNLFKASEKRH